MNEELERFLENNRRAGSFVDKYAFIKVNSSNNVMTVAALIDLIMFESKKPDFEGSMKGFYDDAIERLGVIQKNEVQFPED